MVTETKPQNQDTPRMTNPTDVPKGSGKEQGASGTLIYSGLITNEEYNRKLVGKRGLRVYDEMRRGDSGVQQLLKAVKQPILSVQWKIDEASDDDLDQYAGRFIKRELFDHNINFHSTNREALTCLDFGWSLFETTLELTEFEGKTRVGLKTFNSRKQLSIDKWETMEKKPGVTQQLPGQIIDIEKDRLVTFTNEREGDNYEGRSLLRAAYKDYDIRNKLIIANAVSLEKLGGGIPVLKAPPQADKKDMEKARAALRAMRINQEAYIELPEGWEVEMLDMKSNSVKDMLPTIQYHETMMKKSIMASFLDLGSNSGGSRAVSEDHSKMFEKSLEAVAQVIADTFNEQVIKPLCDMNFTHLPNGYPKLSFGNIGDEDLQVMGEYLSKLAGADLITPDADLEDYLRAMGRMPKLPKEIRDKYDERPGQNVAAPVAPAALPTTTKPAPGKPGKKPADKAGAGDLPTDPRNKPSDKKTQATAAAAHAKQLMVEAMME